MNIQLIIQEANQLFISHLKGVGGRNVATWQSCSQPLWVQQQLCCNRVKLCWAQGLAPKSLSPGSMDIHHYCLSTVVQSPFQASTDGFQKSRSVKHMPWERWCIEDLEVFVLMSKKERRSNPESKRESPGEIRLLSAFRGLIASYMNVTSKRLVPCLLHLNN